MTYFKHITLLLLTCFVFGGFFCARAEKKVALIVGNQNYDDENFDNLPTCINDAKEMNRVLTGLGYSTIVAYDATKDEMLKAIDQFARQIKNADVAVFFFSGHATCIGRDLYMVPSRSGFLASSLSDQLVRVTNVRGLMEKNSRLSLLFLDACRDDATTDSGKTKGQRTPANLGLSGSSNDLNSSKATGCMIFYATQDGRKASIGNGSLSPFTQALTRHLTDGDEFRTVWSVIKKEVVAIAPNQCPSSEDTYANDFYFNPTGAKNSAPVSSSKSNSDTKKRITIYTNATNATIDFYGKQYNDGQPLIFEKGKSYVYKITADGYQPYIGKIDVTEDTPNVVNITLAKTEPAKLYITTNRDVSVYMDGKYVGSTYNKTATVTTVSGRHSIRLTANNCAEYNADVDLKKGNNYKYYALIKYQAKYWDWDEDYDGSQYVSYHFSPEYQIGLSYLYRPEDSRFSYGAFVGLSTGLFKGIKLTSAYSESYTETTLSYTMEIGGVSSQYLETTTLESDKPIKTYNEDIDPDHKVKKYDANALILANFGYNPCNGIIFEAGVGAGYHQDKLYLPFTSYLTKTVTQNLNTGEYVGEPKYGYIQGTGETWFHKNTKWSPAFRLGAKALIPLDGWDTYFLSVGGGYTFLFNNSKYSSWDATLGFAWTF